MKSIIFLIVLISCSSKNFNDFKNLSYLTEWAKDNSIELKNGKAVLDKTEFSLIEPLYSSNSYFAVLLVTSPPGSGVFRDLAIFSKDLGQVASIHLGDRVKVLNVEFKDEFLEVSMISHGPEDPMCCPTLKIVRKFLIKDKFTLVE